ncbi:MAG: hypothetical protein HC849_11930 [Oscillatoriales cyanobacterium RU_3_3]|nr:hypothetical protein [Microcoleus sp. SM1_3_4]NJM60751.1 hypothetical protein [Oscillatoriales cyanobacterium RU_3_3]
MIVDCGEWGMGNGELVIANSPRLPSSLEPLPNSLPPTKDPSAASATKSAVLLPSSLGLRLTC